MQSVEIGVSIDAQDNRLAIDDEMLLAAASTIQGKRFVQSYPPRVISRT
jgi:hypothetical protein